MTDVSPVPIVHDDEALHRVVNPRSNALNPDGTVHYMAFYSNTDPHRVSVDRAAYRTTDDSLREWPGCGLAKLIAKHVRAIKLAEAAVRVDALPEDGNDAHAEIVAPTDASKKKVKTVVCVRLAELASVCVKPPTAA
jgi:hypothetical protein